MWKKIQNNGVALAEARWRLRCFSVGLTVASGGEPWKSGAQRMRAVMQRGYSVGLTVASGGKRWFSNDAIDQGYTCFPPDSR